MSVQKFLKSSFSSSLAMLGGEEIEIGNETVKAVIDEVTSSNSIGIAAVNTERQVTAQFPTGAFSGTLKSGMRVNARGKKWQVSSEPDSIRIGTAATTITLIEPERRDQ